MTDTPKEVELFLVWNEDGDVVADMDHDTAIERLTDDFGGQMRREMKITISIPLPKPIETKIDIPEETAAATVTVAG